MENTQSSGDNPFLKFWAHVAPLAAPPIAAGGAVAVIMRDMMKKGHVQIYGTTPSVSLFAGILQGVKAAPVVGATVAFQMMLQGRVQRVFTDETEDVPLLPLVASSTVVGIISSPLLLAFNAQTTGKGALQGLKECTPKKGGMISIQEGTFVVGLAGAKPLGRVMRAHIWDHPGMDTVASFMASAGGSILGHPANTAVTLWQEGMQVSTIRGLYRGVFYKARGTGFFGVFYKVFQDILMPKDH